MMTTRCIRDDHDDHDDSRRPRHHDYDKPYRMTMEVSLMGMFNMSDWF